MEIFLEESKKSIFWSSEILFGKYPIKGGTLLISEGWLNSGYGHILKAYSETFHLHPKLGLYLN